MHARLIEAASLAEDWAETGQRPATIPWEGIPLEKSPSEGIGKTMQIHFGDERDARVHARRTALLACVLSGTIRLDEFAPAWRTSDVTALARAAYEECTLPSGELALDRLCVLADALEEAGAAEEAVAHLRGPGPHVRGCWAVDLCLGKS